MHHAIYSRHLVETLISKKYQKQQISHFLDTLVFLTSILSETPIVSKYSIYLKHSSNRTLQIVKKI